jgi:hypothetical protein
VRNRTGSCLTVEVLTISLSQKPNIGSAQLTHPETALPGKKALEPYWK